MTRADSDRCSPGPWWKLSRDMRGAVLVVSAALMLTVPAFAQDVAKMEAGLEVWKQGGCESCHGAFAEGGGGGDRPDGPSLRQTRLNREALVETISCGRPGTSMPYHLARAYTEVECFGIRGAVPSTVQGSAELSAAEIQSLVEYLVGWIVGKGRITREECARYYRDPASPFCRSYRPQ